MVGEAMPKGVTECNASKLWPLCMAYLVREKEWEDSLLVLLLANTHKMKKKAEKLEFMYRTYQHTVADFTPKSWAMASALSS